MLYLDSLSGPNLSMYKYRNFQPWCKGSFLALIPQNKLTNALHLKMVRQFAVFLAEVWSKLFANALTTVVVPTDWPLAIACPGLLSLTKQHVIC